MADGGTRSIQLGEELPIHRLLRPFQEFARVEAAGGILLLLCTAAAMIWANSPARESYAALWETRLTLSAGSFGLSKSLLLWINDGLMAIFFLVVGLEIKREVLVGELSSARRAALPIIAAAGGMIAPALIYLAVNRTAPGFRGWGVPMATDIAFSLGILALLGPRVPTALKVFLTAFAIADDLGAVLVIALFYTETILWSALAAAAGILLLLLATNRAGVRDPVVYALLGIALWVAFLKSGIHATIAGVLLALTIPARARLVPHLFLERSRALLEQFEQAEAGEGEVAASAERQAAVHTLEEACEQVMTPLERLEHALHPWVTWAILPLFALANAGVSLSSAGQGGFTHPVSAGVFLGLLLGKPLGITLFAWVAVRSGLASLPRDVTWRQIHGAGWLGGIGFTMALFIADLAFEHTPLLTTAKLGILGGSLVAGVVGYSLLLNGAKSRVVRLPS